MKSPLQKTIYSVPPLQKVEHFGRHSHILIIDQDVFFASMLQKSLETLGYEITITASGQAALHLLGSISVDLVLLDPLLPDMDGYLLCAEIQRVYNTPLVIMSQLNIDKALSALSSGASAIVYKPFRLLELVAEVHKILDTASSLKGLHALSLLEKPGEQVGHYAYNSDWRYWPNSG